MGVLDGKEVLGNLKKKGFTSAKHKSVNHKYLEFYHNGQLITHTKVSHGGKKDISDVLIKQMAYQCKIEKKNFVDFAKCKITKDGYINLLKEGNHI